MGDGIGPRLRRAPWFLVPAVLAAQAYPTFHAAYQAGLAAQARGDHAAAVKAFARAAALEPTPGTRVHTYGLNFLPTYHPYLRWAESALALGDAATAEMALLTPGSMAKEPASEREALLTKVKALKAAAAKPPVPKPAAPAPAGPATPPASQGPPASALPPPAKPAPAPAAQAGAPLRKPDPRPEARASEPAPPIPATPAIPATVSPAPDPPAQAAVPRRRWPWAVLAGAGLAVAGWAVARRGRRRARPSWSRLADALADAPTVTEPDPNLGRRFGPWEARRVLGRGGCATAYYGVHTGTGQEVVIKVPHAHLLQDRDFLTRFRREATLGALLDHPRLVRILDPGPGTGDPWLVMPFVKGVTLEAHLHREAALPVAEAVHIATDVAEAIAHAHAKGVVHRDLKPANILLTEAGAVVMDLGIARLVEGGKLTSIYVGTPTYSAPESVVNPSVGPPADRYALGVILFEMLTGRPPFEGDTPFLVFEAHRFEPLPDLAALRPLAPPALQRLVQRLCEKAPEDRPEDLETLAILRELRLTCPL